MPPRPLHVSPRKKHTDAESTGTPWITRGQLAVLVGSAFVVSGALSVAIQSLRPPLRPLPAATVDAKTREIDALIANTLSRPQAATIEFSEAEINTHLTHALSAAALRNTPVRFKRAGVRLLDDRIEWTSLHEYAGFEFQLQSQFKVWVSNGKIQIQREATHLGRLPLSPFYAEKTLRWLGHLWSFLKKETALLNRLDALQLVDRRVRLKIRSSSPASPSDVR